MNIFCCFRSTLGDDNELKYQRIDRARIFLIQALVSEKFWKLTILKLHHFNSKESFLYIIGDYVLFLVQHSGNHKNDKIADFTWKKFAFEFL